MTKIEGAAIPITHEVCSETLIRLRIGDVDAATPSYLAARPAMWGAEPGSRVSGPTLRIGQAPSTLEFCDRQGNARLRLDLSAMELDGRWRLRFEIVGEQHFYGLGQGGEALDRLGVSRRLWNAHVNHGPGGDIGIPLLLSHLGYGLLFDNPRFAVIDSGTSNDRICFDYEVEAGAFDLYYLDGGGLRGVLGVAADLLGHASMPPRWALGYMQSTRHFDSADEARSLATTLRDKRMPCDTLIFLSTYNRGKGWNQAVGQLEYEPTVFPDPATTIADFRRNGFRVITHEYPVVHEDSPSHAEAVARGYLLDDGYGNVPPADRTPTAYFEGQRFIDFANPEVGQWWWGKHRELVADGVEGWWLDGGEGPTAPSVLTEYSDLHNRFDLFRQRAFAEGEARDNPDRRPLLLCRSGGAGMQRYGAGCWSGDINNTWTVLEAQASLGLNVGLSGVPLWGTDIGGFYPSIPQSGELFARWFQFGAFNPIFRCHGHNWRMHLPWAYGAEIEDICRRVLELRYALMPYTYSLAWQAHRKGLPFMRALALNYPDDPAALDRTAEFLWGDDILVAPVTRDGARQWPVYLPKGMWFDFWTGEKHEGGRGIEVAAPLDRIPLFIRAGAIIPTGPVRQNLKGYAPEEMTLRVYPEGSGTFELYEDDGETNGYRRGHYALTTLATSESYGRNNFRIGAVAGDSSVLPAGRTYRLEIHSPHDPKSVHVNGAEAKWKREGRFFSVGAGQGPSEIEITW